MDKDRTLEEMMGKLGDFGRYQCFQFILHILAAMTAGMHMLSLVTVAAVPEHRCALPGENSTHYEPFNSTVVLNAIPLNEHGKIESCFIYGPNRTIEECQEWIYNTQYFTSSRAIEWNFVCDRRWMGAVAQTAYMFGVVIGSLAVGQISDKFGRRTAFLWSGVLQLIFGASVAFTADFYTFLAIRFLYGIFGSGSYIAGFVLTMELVGANKRTICGVAFQVMFAVGIALLALWGYLLHDNRFYLQLIYAAHAILLLPHWILMDESPRWLWLQGRARESVAIIQKALKYNRSNEKLDAPLLVSNCKAASAKFDDETSAGTIDLFRTRNMLKKTIIICLCWFVNSVVYYGLALNTGKLSGNPFFILFLMAIVELPAYVVNVYFTDRVGHRALISTMMLLGGLCCLVVAALPHGSAAVTGVVMIGKLFISGSYSILYKYSAELYPTVVRSSGVGLGSMCASISGALTPLILLFDSLSPTIPTLMFGFFALLSGFSTFFLPETLGRKLPQTVSEGEQFGVGDTCFTNCTGRKMSTASADIPETMVPLEAIEKKS